MNKIRFSFPSIAIILCLAVVPANSQTGKRRFSAKLLGINEVAAGVGAVSTAATGSFRATLSKDGTSISYRLQYSDLEGDITQAHIHVGQTHTAGGISVWLCQTLTNPAPAAVFDITPSCGDPRSDTVVGTLTAENVIGPAGSGIEVNEFAELLELMRSEVTYANVHSSKFGPGEIRGQIK